MASCYIGNAMVLERVLLMQKQKNLIELLKELGITTEADLDKAYKETVGMLDLGIMISPISIEKVEVKDAV